MKRCSSPAARSRSASCRSDSFSPTKCSSQLSRGHREPWTAIPPQRLLSGRRGGQPLFVSESPRAGRAAGLDVRAGGAGRVLDKYLSRAAAALGGRPERSFPAGAARGALWRLRLRAPISTAKSASATTVSRACSRRRRPRCSRFATCSRAAWKPLLREVRRIYRLGGGEKLSALAQGQAT